MGAFINLDIGILLGSQSDSIFDEMVELYPGAKQLLTAILTRDCKCGDPSCGRRCFQFVLDNATGGDKERAARFIEEGKELTTCEQVRELMVKYHEEICPHSQGGLPEDGIMSFTNVEELLQFLADSGALGGGSKH